MKKLLLTLLSMSSFAFGAELDTGNTAWMMTATAFVMLMTPAGLALFYGGMTRSKNILNTYSMVFLAYAIGSIVWVLWGYSLTFSDGGSANGFIGGLENILLHGITADSINAQGYPDFVFVAFQGTFAAITVAIASGSVIDRMKFSTWMLFVVFWITLVYAPVAHMVWGGGFLFDDGALDFAGGTVVHMNGGLAGLILAILIGKRKGFNRTAMAPSSVILTALGSALLWFGWFGFNAGSEFGADGVAGSAFLMTNFAAAVGVVTWIVIEMLVYKKATLLGGASGAIAGLVAITPAAGFVDVGGAFIIGFGGSLFGFFGVAKLKKIFGYDDSLDAFGIHYLAGLWGAIATGFFALQNLAWDGPLKDGDRMMQIWIQIKSVAVTTIYTAIATVVVFYIVSAITKGQELMKKQKLLGLMMQFMERKGLN